MNRIQKLIERGFKQKDLAEMLGVSDATISKLKTGKELPTKRLEKQLDNLFFEGRKPHPDPIIEKVIVMMEEMDVDTKENALSCVQKEKLLKDLMEEKAGKEAA